MPRVGLYDRDSEEEWINVWKHGVTYDEAESVVMNALSRTLPDLEHSALEERYRTIGWSYLGRLLVVTSESGPRPRIISAWRATKRDRRAYERR